MTQFQTIDPAAFVQVPSTLLKAFSIQGPMTWAESPVTANILYVGAIQVPYTVTLTGITCYNGGTTAGNVIVALYNSSGTRLAQSSSATQTGAFSGQNLPFTSSYAAAPGMYFLAIIYSSDSATAALIGAAFGPSAALSQGGFSAPSFITPPTTPGAGVMAIGTY